METVKFQRNTKQRQVILEKLRQLENHPTASELYKVVREDLPRISLGTVYRNLELLTRMGLVRKLNSNGTEARYDGIPEHHYHIRCIRCDRIDDLIDPPEGINGKSIKQLGGYEITGYHFEFTGICPNCKEQEGQQ